MPFALFNLLKKEFGRFNRIICSNNYLLLENFFYLFKKIILYCILLKK